MTQNKKILRKVFLTDRFCRNVFTLKKRQRCEITLNLQTEPSEVPKNL